MRTVLLSVAVLLGLSSASLAVVDRCDLKSTIRGMIQVLEARDFKGYLEYIEPAKLKREMAGVDLEDIARQAREHPEEMQKTINWLKLALTLEPRFDRKTGLYTFNHKDLPEDMAFIKIDGKFYATDAHRESAAAGDSTNRTDAADGKGQP